MRSFSRSFSIHDHKFHRRAAREIRISVRANVNLSFAAVCRGLISFSSPDLLSISGNELCAFFPLLTWNKHYFRQLLRSDSSSRCKRQAIKNRNRRRWTQASDLSWERLLRRVGARVWVLEAAERQMNMWNWKQNMRNYQVVRLMCRPCASLAVWKLRIIRSAFVVGISMPLSGFFLPMTAVYLRLAPSRFSFISQTRSRRIISPNTLRNIIKFRFE